MEGEGMVAVVRGLRDAGLAVTLLDGGRQYTLVPNSFTHTTMNQRGPNSNTSTQQSPPKNTADISTESSILQCESGAQAIDGRYASTYKTVHCNLRPTSPTVHLSEFPPQRPDVCPGHGNFIVGGNGSGARASPIRASPPTSFRGGMSWPDRGSVCSPRPSHEVDAFANSLRKYPNISPDRSSEVIERLISYTQPKGLSKTSPRRSPDQGSPTRFPEASSHHTLEPKNAPRTPRSYEPEVTIRSKKVEEAPTRDKKKDEYHDLRPMRNYDIRCIRDMSKRLRESVKAISSYSYDHSGCPTIKENHNYQPCEHQNSTHSVNMEIQAAVKMISREAATVHLDQPTRKTVPDSPISSAGDGIIEGECYFARSVEPNTSFKSIQTTFCPSDIHLKPRKSAQTVWSSIDFKSKQREGFIDDRKSRSQEEIKMTSDDLRKSLIELIKEVSTYAQSKKHVRDELIKKLFDTDRIDPDDNKSDTGNSKHERCHKYVSTFCPCGCDYIGDYEELLGKLKYCYGNTKHVLHSEIKPSRIPESKQLDYVLKDWISNLNIKTMDEGRYMDRGAILNTVEDQIKDLFKNRTKQDFDLKSGIVKIIEEIPIEVKISYNRKFYLHRLVDVLLKRLKNVVMCQQKSRNIRRFPIRSKKILTEDDIRDFIREHLLDFFNECHVEIFDSEMNNLENAIVDILIGSIDCIRCGHIDETSDEIEIMLQDLGNLTDQQANYITHVILQNLQEILNDCNFNKSYTILHSNVNSGQYTNNIYDTDFSIEGINDGDLHANLDQYTNQISQQINEWLDGLNISQIHDSGFKEVVVNDLAGDIVDRHKYIELNPNVRGTEEDELDTLKYQIFKWVNKLVGEDNTETIGHAQDLMTKIKTVPVPMLTNPQGQMNYSAGQQQPFDPMRPCLGETGDDNCRKEYNCKNSTSPSNNPQANVSSLESHRNTQCSPGRYAKSTQYTQPHPGPYGPTSQSSRSPQEHYSHIAQVTQGHPGSPSNTARITRGSYSNTFQGSEGSPRHYSDITQGSSGHPASYLHNTQGSQPPQKYYGQSFPNVNNNPNQNDGPTRAIYQGQGFPAGQVSPGGHSSRSLYTGKVSTPKRPQDQDRNQQRNTPANYSPRPVPSSTPRNPAGNLSQIPVYETESVRPTLGRMSSPGGMSGQVNVSQPPMYDLNQQPIYCSNNQLMSAPNQQSMFDPNEQSMFDPNQQSIFDPKQRSMFDPNQQSMFDRNQQPILDPNQQLMFDANQQSMFDPNQQYGARTGVMVATPQSIQIMGFTGPLALGQTGVQMTSSGPGIQGATYDTSPQMTNPAMTGTRAGADLTCCPFQDCLAPTRTSLKQLNDEYDEFLKQWVRQIPIAAINPPEQQLAEKARLGIYNGIWKIITQIKLDPQVFANPYYYQDVFDEELGALLENLPKTQELEANKHRLKAQLLEKTVAMNDLIRSTNAPASFKQQLIESIENNLPKTTVTCHQTATDENEEVQKINLAEHFILYTRYKDEDSLKSNVHKTIFLKSLQIFLDTVRNNCSIDMNTDMYANEIINSLGKVPIPHPNAMKDEADDILLGIEVENWISDLPVELDNTRPLEKKRIRNAIVKKLHELGTIVSYTDCSFARLLKIELRKYLEKIPIQQGTNIDFMMQELANRVKNLSREIKQKAVSFQEPQSYEEFSRNMPASSSYTDHRSQQENSYMIVGGNVVEDCGPKSWGDLEAFVSEEEQWQSLQMTRAPSGLVNWSQGQQSQQSQPYFQNISDHMPVSGNYPGDFSYSAGTVVPDQTPNLGISGAFGQVNSNVRGSPAAGTQMALQGPCCNNAACLNRPQSPIQGPQSPCCSNVACLNRPQLPTQGPPGPYTHSTQNSHFSQGSFGQGFSNAQGNPVPYNQDLSFGQMSQNIPMTSQGPNVSLDPTGQGYQEFYAQGFPNIQSNIATYKQGQSFGQVSTPYDQVTSVPVNHVPILGPNAAQMSQVSQGPYTSQNVQVPASGLTGYYGIRYQSGQPSHLSPSNQVQPTMPSLRRNQTAQSFGPLLAASEVPNISRSGSPQKPNLQEMAGPGMGIPDRSQEPGPSEQAMNIQTGQPLYLPSGAQPSPEFYKSTDSKGIRQIIDQNKSQRQIGTPLGTPATPTMGQPVGFSTPQQQHNRECPQRPSKKPQDIQKPTDGARRKLNVDETDTKHHLRHCICGTDPHEQNSEEIRASKVRPLDINEKQIFNMKSVQTAFSTIDIKTTKWKYCEIRSKSQEELTKITKRQEVFKRKDLGKGDLQQEVTEWFEIHSDKVKVKLWGEKMQRLAEKLKKPGGEEKLRMKIEKYLKKVPDQLSEGDDDKMEFRKQLPDDIIRKLKKLYINPTDANINVYRMELSKCCSKFKIENFKKVTLNWLKSLNIKKKDFLGRNVKKDDVFKYVTNKLEPLVLDRPKSDSEYKSVLISNITDIIDDLPLVLGSHNKEFYVNIVTEALVNEILNIESKVPRTYIQPTIKEIKEFVKYEITFFLEKSRIAISTKRTECLETELLDVLLDLTDIVDIDNYVIESVTAILKDIGKIPEYKAKYFTNLLLRDYKEFYFRQSFFQENDKSNYGQPDDYSAFQNSADMVDTNTEARFDIYTQRLIGEITVWLSKIDIPDKDKSYMEVVVKDFACDIVDRHKYLVQNPKSKGTNAEEFEHLKYLIFKWTNRLVGEENTVVLENAQELLDRINNIPKPSLPSTSNGQSMSPQGIRVSTDTKPYNEKLTDEIYDWFRELPIDLHVSQDASLNKQFIKDFAEGIEKALNTKDFGVIGKEVYEWNKKVFNNKLNSHQVEQLENRIMSVTYTEIYSEKYSKQEKVLIRSFEDIVDEWIDTIPIEPKKEGLFINSRYEFIHQLAVKIYNIKMRLKQSPEELLEKKLQEEISDWMKKLPLHLQADKQNHRDKCAAKLVNNIQAFNIDESIQSRPIKTGDEFVAVQLEGPILEWLKKLPLYRNTSLHYKEKQEKIMKELANRVNVALRDGNRDPDELITEHVQMLDPRQNSDFVQNTALQLKFYLQKHNMFGDVSQRVEADDDFFVANIEVWISNLPLDVTEVSHFEKQKGDFIKSMKRLKFSGSNSAVIKKEIITFMKALPMDCSKRDDIRYLEEEALQLIQKLTVVPFEGISRESPLKTTEIISDAIKDWTNTLPLKPVYCPRELRSFIDDMSSVITTLLVHPEYSRIDENDRRLHREIIKFLKRFPLQHEQSTEKQITQMAEELAKTLKDIQLFRDDDGKSDEKNVTVYEVSLGNTANNSLNIREGDINANLDTYTRQLVHQISEWFDNLNFPNVKEEVLKEVVINDLAGDIMDRHKYLEFNPESRGTEEDELEHLKYQIFKWVNKLVGEENLETIDHADDLMKRIQVIPVPILARPQDKSQILPRPCCNLRNSNLSTSPRTRPVTSQQVNAALPDDVSSGEQPPQLISKRTISPGTLAILNSAKCCTQESPPALSEPQVGTKEAIYEKYQKIFREKCNALPIDASTPEAAKLSGLAKTGIYNGIVKTFFNLKSDPEIENDYGYFEFMIEERIEDMLDILPQTEELVNRRHAWKLEILSNALDMLDELHGLTDRPSFRQRVRNKFNRKFARDLELEECFLLQQGFLAEMADAYILETKYKEEDPLKANIYKHRLMKKIDVLANHLAKEHSVGFRFFKKAQLARIAKKVLEQVPIPNDDILQEEAEEIQLADEIEKWYKELPTKPLINDTDGVLRKRMMDLLAKKLYDIKKRVSDQDSSKEAQMKHEVSLFLERRAKLQQDQDLNINFMVDELNNRLKNQWLKEPADYSIFKKEKPFSSTFAQVDNNEFLAPLMDAVTSTGSFQGQVYHDSAGQTSLRDQQSIVQSNLPPSQNYVSQTGYPVQSMGQIYSQPRASTYEGIVNTSQIGPSQAINSVQDSGQSCKLDTSHQLGPSGGYISQQVVPMQSTSPDLPHGIGISQCGPSEGYISQQSPHMQSMGQKATTARNTPGAYVETSQFGPGEMHISQQYRPRQHMSRAPSSPRSMHGSYLQKSQVGPNQGYVTQQGPQRSSISQVRSPHRVGLYAPNLNASEIGPPQGNIIRQGPPTQSIAHASHKNPALRTSQVACSPRVQNINQSLDQRLGTSQVGPIPQGQSYDQNMPNPGAYGTQGQVKFSPNYPTQGHTPTDVPGYSGRHRPTPSQRAATTAQVRNGFPDVEIKEGMENDYMRCKCLEAYRRRKRCFECNSQCPRYRPYRCYN